MCCQGSSLAMRTSFVLLLTPLPPTIGIVRSKGPFALIMLRRFRNVDFRKFSSPSIMIEENDCIVTNAETGGRYCVSLRIVLLLASEFIFLITEMVEERKMLHDKFEILKKKI